MKHGYVNVNHMKNCILQTYFTRFSESESVNHCLFKRQIDMVLVITGFKSLIKLLFFFLECSIKAQKSPENPNS